MIPMPTIPRILLLGMVILTVGADLVVGAWEQRTVQGEIRILERDLEVQRVLCREARAHYQGQILAACEVGLSPPPDGDDQHGVAARE